MASRSPSRSRPPAARTVRRSSSITGRSRTSLPAGNVVVIEPGRSDAMWQVGDVLHNPVVAKQDKESPLMAHIRLDNVLMPEARKLTLKAPAQVLAESASGRSALRDPGPARDGQVRQGRGADRRPRQERPAAPDGVPDHDDEPAELVQRHQGRAARVAADGHGRRGRDAGRTRTRRLTGRWCSARPTARSGRSPCRPVPRRRRSARSTGSASGRSSSAPQRQDAGDAKAKEGPRRRRPGSWSPSCRATWPIAARATCGRPRDCRNGRPTWRPAWPCGRSGTI